MKLSVTQGGFRKHRSTLDQIGCLKECLDFIRTQRHTSYVAFLDIAKAYDSVPRVLLWEKCRRKGMDNSMIKSLQSLFDFNRSKLCVNGFHSGEIVHQAGLLQGTVLSPLLYSIFIDDLADELINIHGKNGVQLNDGTEIRALLYADDIAIISDNHESMQRMLMVAEEHSLCNGYKFNVDKCEFISSEQTSTVSFQLYNSNIPRALSFTYLGIIFDGDGIAPDATLDRFINKANNASKLISFVGCQAGNGFDYRSAVHIYRTFLRPVLEYGIWLLIPVKKSKTLVLKLESAQHKLLCETLGIARNTSALMLRYLSGLPSMATRIECLRIKATGRLLVINQLHEHSPNMISLSINARAPSSIILDSYIVALERPVNDDDTVGRIVARMRRKCISLEQAQTRQKIEEKYGILVPEIAFQGTHPILDNRTICWQDAKWILRWLLNKIPGQPTRCQSCDLLRASRSHLEQYGDIRQHMYDFLRFQTSLKMQFVWHLVPLRDFVVEFFIFHEIVLSLANITDLWLELSFIIKGIATSNLGWTLISYNSTCLIHCH